MIGIRDGEYMGRAAGGQRPAEVGSWAARLRVRTPPPPHRFGRQRSSRAPLRSLVAGGINDITRLPTWARQTAAPTARTSLCAHAEGKRVGRPARAFFRNTPVKASCNTRSKEARPRHLKEGAENLPKYISCWAAARPANSTTIQARSLREEPKALLLLSWLLVFFILTIRRHTSVRPRGFSPNRTSCPLTAICRGPHESGDARSRWTRTSPARSLRTIPPSIQSVDVVG